MRRTRPLSVYLHPNRQLALLLGVHRPVRYFGHPAANEVDVFLQQAIVELLVSLAGCPHVDVKVVDFGPGPLFDEMCQFQRVHATHSRAVSVGLQVAAADTVEDTDRRRLGAVRHHHLTVRRPGRVDHSLKLQTGVDVGVLAVPESVDPRGIEGLEPGGENDRSHRHFLDFLRLCEINGVLLAGRGAGLLALVGLELDARLIVDHRHQRRRLWKRHVDRLAFAQSDIELVRRLAGLVDTGVDAIKTAHALILDHVARLAPHLHREVADESLDAFDFRIRPQRDIGVRPDRRHLRRQNACRAVKGWKGLVELGHVSADSRLALDQVYFLAGRGHGQGRLNAGDPAAHDHNIRMNRDTIALQCDVVSDPSDRSGYQGLGLLRRHVLVERHPTDMLRLLAIWNMKALPPPTAVAVRNVFSCISGEHDATTTRFTLPSRISCWIISWPGSEHMNLYSLTTVTFGNEVAKSVQALTSTTWAILIPQWQT
jgi:hypothetical protein